MSNKIRIRKRGNTFSYSFEIGRNPRRMKEKGGYANKNDAYEAGIKAYADWKSGNIGITSERVNLCDYLTAWLENVMQANLKRSTYSSYENTVHARILPYLGELNVQDIRPRNVDVWLRELAKKGYAYKTIHLARAILSMSMKYAVYPAELISSNPVTGISIPQLTQLPPYPCDASYRGGGKACRRCRVSRPCRCNHYAESLYARYG